MRARAVVRPAIPPPRMRISSPFGDAGAMTAIAGGQDADDDVQWWEESGKKVLGTETELEHDERSRMGDDVSLTLI